MGLAIRKLIMSITRKLFIQFSHFFTASALGMVFGFITFPILTRLLTREEYGMLGLISTTMLFPVAIGKAGLSSGVIRFYEEFSNSEDRKTIFSSTVMIGGLIISVITVGLYLVSLPAISRYLKIKEIYLGSFLIMAFYLLIRPLNIFVMNFLRVNGKTFFYNLLGLIGRVISVGLSLFLFVFVVREIYGYLIGIIVTEFIIGGVLFYWFFNHYRIKISKVSKELSQKIVRFSIPLFLTEVFYLLLSYIDRYMIIAFHGEDALGVYSVGYNLAMYISDIITFSIGYAITPLFVEIYERQGRKKTEEFLKGVLKYLLIGVIPLIIGYYAIAENLIILLASEKYRYSAAFSPIILGGTLLLGLNNLLNAGLYLKKKTGAIFLIMAVAVVINVILNFLLIPSHAVMGASIAKFVACSISTIITYFISNRHVSIKIEKNTILYYLLISLIMLLVINRIEMKVLWIGLMLQMCLGGIIFFSGVVAREKEVRKRLLALFQKRAQSI